MDKLHDMDKIAKLPSSLLGLEKRREENYKSWLDVVLIGTFN